MKIYIDLFFVFNFFMDMIITMGISAIFRRKTSMTRIIMSSVVGSAFSLFLFTMVNKIIIEIISIILMCLISFGYKNIFKNIIYMYLISSVLGGLIYLFNIRINNSFLYYLVISVISMEIIILYVKEMKKIKNNYNNYYKVGIYFDDDYLSLIGFVDTGNNLYDYYKKRPIILMSKKYEKDGNFLLVPYRTLSGSGLLKCIKPKYITIDNKKIENVLVGFSDNIKFIDGVEVLLHKDVMKGE